MEHVKFSKAYIDRIYDAINDFFQDHHISSAFEYKQAVIICDFANLPPDIMDLSKLKYIDLVELYNDGYTEVKEELRSREAQYI